VHPPTIVFLDEDFVVRRFFTMYQDVIPIGVPAYRAKKETSFIRSLVLPFEAQRDSWKFVSGKEPVRYLIPSQGQSKRKLIS